MNRHIISKITVFLLKCPQDIVLVPERKEILFLIMSFKDNLLTLYPMAYFFPGFYKGCWIHFVHFVLPATPKGSGRSLLGPICTCPWPWS